MTSAYASDDYRYRYLTLQVTPVQERALEAARREWEEIDIECVVKT